MKKDNAHDKLRKQALSDHAVKAEYDALSNEFNVFEELLKKPAFKPGKTKAKKIAYKDFKNYLDVIIDDIANDIIPAKITTPSGNSVIIMAYKEFTSLEETAYLMSSPKNAARLVQAIDELENPIGKMFSHEN